MPLLPGARLGPYQVTVQIGQGGNVEGIREATPVDRANDVGGIARNPSALPALHVGGRVTATLTRTSVRAIIGASDEAIPSSASCL